MKRDIPTRCNYSNTSHVERRSILAVMFHSFRLIFNTFRRISKIFEKRLLPSSYLSVYLSGGMEKLGRHCTDFHEIWYLITFRKSVEKIQVSLTFYSLAVSLRTTRFNIQKFYMALALRWVFCTDIRTDSDFCFIQHWLSGFYNCGGKCLLRGTNWFLI